MKVTTFLFVHMNVLFVKTVWKIFFSMFAPTVAESFKNAQREKLKTQKKHDFTPLFYF